MSRRMLLLIVVVLSLCWCVLATLGMVAEPAFDGKLDLNARSFDLLRRRLTAHLPASHLRLDSAAQSGCRLDATTLTVPESVECVYAIQPDARQARQLSLSLGGGVQSIQLVLTQPNALSVEETYEAGQPIDLDIYRSEDNQGAELTIQECVLAKPVIEKDPERSYACTLEIQD